jgi:phosphoribosylanthranilate isomerase
MVGNVIVKICGLTSVDDARAALDAGADCLGFVLYPASPRGITADALERIVRELPADAQRVGVFVNETPEGVVRVAQACRLYAVQIHGDEPCVGFEALPVLVWRAIRWHNDEWSPRPEAWPAERYVLDAPSALYGGTGRRGDWTAAAALSRTHRTMLAGGLTPENVAEAIRTVRPLGVDVSSGVEQAPGRKDVRKMNEFVRRAREAAALAG